MNATDVYVNKSVSLRFLGQDMSFELSHALFSSFDIDQGSKLLLKAVARYVDKTAITSILDIGSGTGVLGVSCARAYPGASLWMRDRDVLACRFSERNAIRDKIIPTQVDHALFLSGLSGHYFDLVVCNVPAKAGAPVLDGFLGALPGMLSEQGYGAIVVVEPIAQASLESLAASNAVIVGKEIGSGHVAVVFRRGPATNEKPEKLDSSDIYLRSDQTLRAGNAAYRLNGYWGLPEFDTPSFGTDLAMDHCEKILAASPVKRALFINPGIGRVACHVQVRAKDAGSDLCARDALALLASRENLSLALRKGAPPAAFVAEATGLPDEAYDLIVESVDVIPRVDLTEFSWNQSARMLKKGGYYVAVMPSSAMDRFEKRKPKIFVRTAERKKKGYACASWRLG